MPPSVLFLFDERVISHHLPLRVSPHVMYLYSSLESFKP